MMAFDNTDDINGFGGGCKDKNKFSFCFFSFSFRCRMENGGDAGG